MKKLLILILIVSGIGLSASAQKSPEYRRYDKKNYSQVHKKNVHKDKKKYQEKRITKINKNYDKRISKVKNDPNLRNKQKNKKVKALEKERKAEIVKARKHYSKKYADGVARDHRGKDKRRY